MLMGDSTYALLRCWEAASTPASRNQPSRDVMAFKPNYGRDRAERARAARARSEEKKRKRDEKTALRKAQRAEVEPPTNETNPRPDEKQS